MEKSLKRKSENQPDTITNASTDPNDSSEQKVPKLSIPKDTKIKLKLGSAIVCFLFSFGFFILPC